ncbi:hypothetical protein [Parasedimentitalea huanghaiensis]|uniref:Tat pathway signal sequence domain protein n=1 Tax=Parasedimentitalea huanghaiensis TaxID=2682100 RepID=A0A6L6WDN3_9RHOB|nr:hypothetical protein [Zongyanglinia huanghaiensis]MVO14695.1 hypothetical protein [Zongyanglinia huanghaiensis]
MTLGICKWKALTALVLSGLVGSAAVSETVKPPAVSIELSAADAIGEACRLSFVVQNSHSQDIASSVYETVLFNVDGQVAQLTLLDFQDLPAGRMRVRQFQFDGLACDDISRVLINGADTCKGEGLPQDACHKNLTLRSLTKMELIG